MPVRGATTEGDRRKRRWWLDRYALDEIRELAGGLMLESTGQTP